MRNQKVDGVSREKLKNNDNLQAGADIKIARNMQKRFLCALFLLLYVPIFCYHGFNLPPDIGIDYPSYFYAARLAFVEAKTPYGLHVFDGIPGFKGGKVQPYIYPPPSLLAFWPLAKLSRPAARNAFIAVSHICCLTSIWLILFKLTPLGSDDRHRYLIFGVSLTYVLSVFGLVDTFDAGQINLIALMFICLAMVAFRTRSPAWLTGLPLSIAILLKTYPVLLLLPLLFRKQYRAIVLTCSYFAAFTLLAYVVLPREVWHTWLVEVVPLGGYGNDRIPAAFCWNQSINAFVMRLFQENYFSKAPLYYPELARPVATGLVFIVLTITMLYSFRSVRRCDSVERGDDEIAAFLLMTYLIAPLSWDHHLVYILPACALAISLLIRKEIHGAPAMGVLGCLLLIAWRFPVDRLDIIAGWWTLLMSAKLYPVFALWLFFIRRLNRSGRLPVPHVGSSNDLLTNRHMEAGVV